MASNNNLPTSVYAGVDWEPGVIHVCVRTQKKILKRSLVKIGFDAASSLLSWFRDYSSAHNVKIIACGLVDNEWLDTIASRLWLELDISPFVAPKVKSPKKAEMAAKYVASQFDSDHSYSAKVNKQQKVITPPLATLFEYESISKPEIFKRLLFEASNFKGKKMVFISATPQGGGVALMRHSLMRIYSLLELDISWHVLLEDPEIFAITKKKFHNVFQGVAEPHVKLDEKEKNKFTKWTLKNFNVLHKVFEKSDVIVIDDPQPSGLVKLIKEKWPQKSVIYRSHIHLDAALADKKDTQQNIAWKFIWENVQKADLFISHPVKNFVPKVVSKKKVIYMGATTDRLDGLNKELSDEQKSYYMRLFNKMLVESGQTPLDHTRPFLIQIARFDPSKGIPDLLESYRRLRLKLDEHKLESPQLVITGNASVDDPDGIPIYQLVTEMLSTILYKKIAADIKILRVPHYDQLLNTLLRESVIALQLSHKEGFEVKVSEALMKGKPVIATRTGGIPLQIRDNKSGYLVNVGDTNAVAKHLFELITNKKNYQNMSVAAMENVNGDVNSIHQATYFLFMANKLLRENFLGNQAHISELLRGK